MKVNQEPTLPKNRLGGIGNGINGTTKRKYNWYFNAFAVIYLANFLASFRGNFTVWPQPHRIFNDFSISLTGYFGFNFIIDDFSS